MADQNCDILFSYLRSILYDDRVQRPDLNSLDPSFAKLGQGMMYLEEAVSEMKKNTASLSKGELSEFHPSRENPLCDNLKNIHANLEHLTWQAVQVAHGDYSQKVSYLGDFSDAFNTMTGQLAEREKKLKEEAAAEREHSVTIERYNRLFLEMIRRSDDDILVTDLSMQNILYHSENTMKEELLRSVIDRFSEIQKTNLGKKEWKWDLESSKGRWYRIVTVLSEWEKQQSYAHYIHDISEEKQQENRLKEAATMDSMTHIYNRYYFEGYMNELIESKTDFVLCYCDLDHLKYVNDHYGHNRGDEYICAFTECVKDSVCDDSLFARIGGDEFCLVMTGKRKEEVRRIMEEIDQKFRDMQMIEDGGFSYGIVTSDESCFSHTLKELLQKADSLMYENKKRKNRQRT